MFVVWHDKGRKTPCVRCHGTYKSTVMGRGSSSHVTARRRGRAKRYKICEKRLGSWPGEAVVKGCGKQ